MRVPAPKGPPHRTTGRMQACSAGRRRNRNPGDHSPPGFLLLATVTKRPPQGAQGRPELKLKKVSGLLAFPVELSSVGAEQLSNCVFEALSDPIAASMLLIAKYSASY